MNITVVGCGKVGAQIAKILRFEKHEITIIDKDAGIVDNLSNTLDVIGYVGNGAVYDVLKSAGVNSKCNILIAVTETDEINMLCCLVAKKLGVKYTIARIRNPEYTLQMSKFEDDLGLAMTINPEKETADEIARMLRFPSATHVELFAGGKAELVSLTVQSGNMLSGMKLSQIPARLNTGVLFCAVTRNGLAVIPDGNFVLSDGDVISMIGTPKEIERTFRKVDMLKNPVKAVIIAGGGHITYYLTEELVKNGIKTRVIEKNANKADALAAFAKDARVMTGDSTDHEVLEESGIADADAYITLMGMDESNILSAMYAKAKGLEKVIVKINNQNLLPLIRGSGLESIVCPKELICNRILRFVRSKNAREGGSVLSLYKLANGLAEVTEFAVEAQLEGLTDLPLSELRSKLKPGILIACIVRGTETIIPHGTDKMARGDRVLVVSVGYILRDLHDILRE